MAEYNFVTYWKLDAPPEEIWELISDISKWHEWWRGVLKVDVLRDELNGKITFAHTWQSIIPYKLKFVTEVTEIDPLKSIQADVTGELEGTGRWEFTDSGDGQTLVTYYWFVRTTMKWMNLTAPFLAGVFRWNHDAVMRWGGEGVAEKLHCRFSFSSKWIR